MSAAAGPGPVPVDDQNLPEGWQSFATADGNMYFCFPRKYYHCRKLNITQWQRPKLEDSVEEDFIGPTINGTKPYEFGDEIIPKPPPEPLYTGTYSDEKYLASYEDPEDLFEPDEEMLEACLDCDLPRLKQALDGGADVSLANEPWQNTPLHLANAPFAWDANTVETETALRLEITKFLIKAGADLDAKNACGCTPLDFAVFHGYPAAAGFLQEQGANFSLMGASFAGRLDTVKELLEDGADIDQEGRYGRTAFAEAHLRGCWRVEVFLAQQGCSRYIPHLESLKFNPGGAALPIGSLAPPREFQYHREDNPEWYDDMMEKRFPGYMESLKRVPKG